MDEKILQIIACPECKGAIEKEGGKLSCHVCGKKYKIVNGIPMLLRGETGDGDL